MGMTAAFVALPSEKLTALQAEPDTAGTHFMEQLEAGSEDVVLDIDKSWHGIHFLLTHEVYGGDGPVSLPILGGTAIGNDLGYGTARYLEPQDVASAADALAGVSVDQLRERFKPAELEEAYVYPTGIWEDEGDEAFEYLAHWYERLQHFYAAAAQRGDAMLLAVI